VKARRRATMTRRRRRSWMRTDLRLTAAKRPLARMRQRLKVHVTKCFGRSLRRDRANWERVQRGGQRWESAKWERAKWESAERLVGEGRVEEG
jgi:hypothetical protein